MGFTGRLVWASSCSKKQWRRLFWKVRAAVKKAGEGRRWRSKHQLKYQYDLSSYALNFDDGSNSKPVSELQQRFNPITVVTTTSTAIETSTTWIYVFWVKF